MRRYILIFAIAASLLLPSPALSADMETISSEGTASKSDDIADVKRRAIDHALKNAVAGAINSILSRESLSAPDAVMQSLLANPRSYVTTYKIRSEGWVTHMDLVPAGALPDGGSPAAGAELYHIWIDASVDKDALRDAITKFLAINGASGPLMINILDVRGYAEFRALVSALQRIAVIKDLSYNTFSNGRITMLAVASGGASNLANRIARELPENYTVVEGAGQIIIRPSKGLSLE
ncbi:MAG TPA: hypothetical protein VII64_13145 [Thermodesulfobacteriota bacterium]